LGVGALSVKRRLPRGEVELTMVEERAARLGALDGVNEPAETPCANAFWMVNGVGRTTSPFALMS